MFAVILKKHLYIFAFAQCVNGKFDFEPISRLVPAQPAAQESEAGLPAAEEVTVQDSELQVRSPVPLVLG